MNRLQLTTHPDVAVVFDNYPEGVREKMQYLRQLVIETAEEIEDIDHLEETLKWGEPSYRTKIGSTLRMDWKEKLPLQYALYFQCTSQLVASFKMAYANMFSYEGNRAIVFAIDEPIPKIELKRCIAACLRYHKVKKIPFLGL